MSYRALLLDRTARLFIFSLISVLICTGASAQSPFAGGGYSNRTAIPGNGFSRYSYSPSWAPRQPGYAPWPRSGGPPAPQGVNSYRGDSAAYSGPTWQQAPPPYSDREGATSDGGRPVPWHRKPPVKPVGKTRPWPKVPVIAYPVPSTKPDAQQPGTPIGDTTPAAPVSPPSTPIVADTPRAPQPGTPIGTSLVAIGALAVSLVLGQLFIKRLQRQRRRNRGPRIARVVLVRDQGRTQMIPTGSAPAAPAIELRLLPSAPVSTLCLVG